MCIMCVFVCICVLCVYYVCVLCICVLYACTLYVYCVMSPSISLIFLSLPPPHRGTVEFKFFSKVMKEEEVNEEALNGQREAALDDLAESCKSLLEHV